MVRFSIGEMSMGLFDLRYAGKLGKDWYFSILGGYMQSKDFAKSRNETVEYEGLPLEAVPLPLDKYTRLSAKFRLDKHFFSGGVLTFETQVITGKGSNFLNTVGRVTNMGGPLYQGRIIFTAKHWNFIVYGWGFNQEFVNLNSGEPMFGAGYRLHGEVQGHTDFAKGKGRIVGGFSLRTERLDADNKQGIPTWLPEAKNTYMGGVFGQVDYQITDKLKAVLAGRFDLSTLHKTPQISPKTSIIYTFNPGHFIRVSYNRAFISRSYAALFLRLSAAPPLDLSALENWLSSIIGGDLNLGFDNIPFLALGNENLEPEDVTSYEVGYSNLFGQRLLLNIDYYRSQHKNFLSDLLPFVNPDYGPYAPPSSLPPEVQAAILVALEQSLPPSFLAMMSNSLDDGSPIFAVGSWTNTGKVNTQGLEISLKYFFNKFLSAYFNYSWFDFKVLEEFLGDSTPNTPQHRINFGASYITDRFDISMRFRWVDDFLWAGGLFKGMVKFYSLVNLTSNFYFGNGFAVGVNISNLLNNKHYQLFGGDILRRNAVAAISYRW
jgi:outer membrane receptor protein involved in Fe transport